jgi:hypothetical protein
LLAAHPFLKVQHIEVVVVAGGHFGGGRVSRRIVVSFEMKQVLRFEAVRVHLVAGKLHKVLLQRRRLSSAAARLVATAAIVDVVIVVAPDERGRRGAVLLDQLELFVHVQLLAGAHAALADRVEFDLAQRRRRALFRLQRLGIGTGLGARRRWRGGRSSSRCRCLCLHHRRLVHEGWRRRVKWQSVPIDVAAVLRRLLGTGRGALGRGTRGGAVGKSRTAARAGRVARTVRAYVLSGRPSHLSIQTSVGAV